MDNAILVFDDANFEGVVAGAKEGIDRAGFDIIYEKLILNDIESPEEWWNGIYITVVNRPTKFK